MKQKTENRKQKTENRKQKTENRKQKTRGLYIIFTFIQLSFCQSIYGQFSNFYGQVASDSDKNCLEFVTCLAVNDGNSYEYVGVQAYEELGSTSFLPHYRIRGVIVKDDGTMYNGDFFEINEQSEGYDIVPLKIIPKSDNSGYVITGYVRSLAIGIPYPFAITTNAMLSPTLFRVFDYYGFFTDVDELPNGDFLFCGSWTNTTNVRATHREAMLMKTSSTFIPQTVRFLTKFSISGNKQRYNVINDAVVINNDEVIICGSLTEQCGRLVPDTNTYTRILLARYNFTNSNLVWQKCEITPNYASARLAVNTGTGEIVLALNAENNRAAAIVRYDLIGNYIFGEHFEFSSCTTNYIFDGVSILNVIFNTHVPFVQNIFFNSSGNLFISGKFIKLTSSSSIPIFDNHWSAEYIFGLPGSPGLILNGILFKNSQQFRARPADFVTYYKVNNNTCVSGVGWQPIWAGSNTLEKVDGTGTFVTITNGLATKPGLFKGNKCWIFTNDLYTCGAIEIQGDVKGFSKVPHEDAIFYIHAPFGYNDLTETEDNVGVYNWYCDQIY
jgi:hypothetical protein